MSAFVRFDSLGLGDFFVAAGRVYWVSEDARQRLVGKRLVTGDNARFDDADLVVPLSIVTVHVYPPIPVRNRDWCAHLDDYDGAPDAGHQPMGEGPTRQAAIVDLAQNIEDWCNEEA